MSTWWRELSLPVRAVLGEDGRLRDVPWGEPGWESDGRRARALELRGAARAQRQPGAPAHRRAAGRVRRSDRRARAGQPRGQVLREGRAPGGDHHEPSVVLQDGRPPRGAARARSGAAVAPPVHARALRGLGQRAHRRLVRQPPALLRGAVPGLVSDRRCRDGPCTSGRSPPRRAAAGRSLHGRARRIWPRAARAAGRASRAIPT